MPLLEKEILPVGNYAVNSPQGRVARSFDVESITRHAATANNMLQRGLRIPCPFAHHKEAVPVKSTVEPSPYNNAGYWELFSIRKNDKGKPALFGIIDLPGSDNEPDSPYYKAKNTAKEVSISIKPEYLDGTGTKWEDVIMHVALVNHPVVPDQEPFKDIPDGSLVVNMSLLETEDELDNYSPGMIASIKNALSQLNIFLPADTSAKTFLRDILTAATQAAQGNQGRNHLEPVPIYMSTGDSHVDAAQAKAIIDAKTLNPTTGKPFTMEDLGFKTAPVAPAAPATLSTEEANKLRDDNKKLTILLSAMSARWKSDLTASIKNRIDSLLASGRITKEIAEQKLLPHLAFELSTTSDGQFAPHPLEATLSAFEALPAAAPTTPNHHIPGAIEIPKLADGTDMSNEDLEKALAEFGQYMQV